MNAFVRHHRASVRFGYSCFDRILCRAAIQAFHHPGGIACFLRHHRQAKASTPNFLRNISSDYHCWLMEKAAQRGVPVVEPPTDPHVRREDWVEPYYQQLGQRCGTAVILKCRERARVVISLPSQGNHLELAWRFVNLYYFYRNDPQCGRLFLRLCPYFPFNGQVCLNGHDWLARQMDREGIAYDKSENSFLDCANPQRLQELADAFDASDMLQALNRGLEDWLAFFTPAEDERYLDVQQDVLVSSLDRGQLEQLRRPSISPSGRRTPGMHCDDRRLIAVLQALLSFVHLVGKGCFRTAGLLADVQRALDRPDYRLSQLRYDIGKLRGKNLVSRIPKTQSYQLTPEGYRVAILYCKLYYRLYAPLMAGALDPFANDAHVGDRRRAKLDRLYSAVDKALAHLTEQIGLSA